MAVRQLIAIRALRGSCMRLEKKKRPVMAANEPIPYRKINKCLLNRREARVQQHN